MYEELIFSYDAYFLFLQLLQRNIDRIGKIGASVASTGAFIASLFTWQYKFRSAFAFLVYIMLVLNFSVYLFTLGILLAFLKQYVVHVLLSERNVSPEDQVCKMCLQHNHV